MLIKNHIDYLAEQLLAKMTRFALEGKYRDLEVNHVCLTETLTGCIHCLNWLDALTFR